MSRTADSFFSRWTVIPVLQNRLFIVRDENDADYPILPISPNEYERLRAATDAESFQAILLDFKNTERSKPALARWSRAPLQRFLH
ncbi:MAG: hypothetical protein WA855_13755 [Candidatus Acidiferrales bacterium]